MSALLVDGGAGETSPFDVPPAVDAAVGQLAAAQQGVVSGEQLIRLGVPETTMLVRARPGGRYLRILPGVFAVGDGPPSSAGQARAALLYAGSSCAVLTGLAALHVYGFDSVERVVAATGVDPRLHVLVPHAVRRESHGFVRIERTRYVPDAVSYRGLQLAPVARAVVDAGRTLGHVDLVRPVVLEALRRRLVANGELAQLVATVPMRGSTAIRAMIDETGLGVDDDSVSLLRDVLVDARLPLPHFMPSLYDRHGVFLSRVHAFRAPEGIAFLLSDRRELLNGLCDRLEDLHRTGVLVLSVDTVTLADAPAVLLEPYRHALRAAVGRPTPAVRVIRAPGGVSGRHGPGAV